MLEIPITPIYNIGEKSKKKTAITADELYLEMDEALDAGEWKSAYDAEYLGDDIFSIDSQASEDLKGQPVYTFEEGVRNSQETYFAIEVNNLSKNELATRIIMSDASGECSIGRTGTILKPGRNLILFSCLGFRRTVSLCQH